MGAVEIDYPNVEDRQMQRINDMLRRIADLELTLSKKGTILKAGPPSGSAPTSQYYYDTTNKRLWFYNGVAWIFERAYDATKRPGVVLSSASQAVGAGLTVTNSWTTENSDVDGWIVAPSATLTVPTGWDGCYAATYRTAWSSSSSSDIESIVTLNGTAILNAGGPLAFGIRSATGQLRGLVAGDTIDCRSYNGAAISLNMNGVLVLDWLYR